MNNDIDNYKKGAAYEVFIHRALKSSNRTKPGTHGATIQNLIRIENGNNSFVKQHGTFEKQLADVKKYIHKGFDKYLKMKTIPIENLKKLEILKTNTDLAKTSDDLMAIIYESNELTESVKNY